MTVISKVLSRVLAWGLVASTALAQELEIRVTNPSGVHRMNEPVAISWGEIQNNVPAVLGKLRLVDEEGRSLAFQVDDLDADGKEDEFVFVTGFAPNQRKRFVLTSTADSLPLPTGPFRTDVANFKRIGGASVSVDDDDGPGTLRSQGQYPFDGVGWESEVIGFRVYLDERNAIDIQAKRFPALHWDYIGRTGVNYQLDAYWGTDVLHVGGALGVGGMGIWGKGSVVHPLKLDRRRTRVIARGPVRAVARVDYTGWEAEGEKADVTSLFMIYGGDRITEHRVILRSAAPKTIAVGIVKHPQGKEFWDATRASLHTVGAQSRTNDSLLLALSFDPKVVAGKTEDKWNHLVQLRLEHDKPLKYLISAYWEGETGTMWSNVELNAFLENAGRRLNEPLGLELAKTRP